MKKWYVANSSNVQGLIIDEKTGDNIAVSYKKEDAPLIAAAPELLEACNCAYEIMNWIQDKSEEEKEAVGKLLTAISKAREVKPL